MLDDDNMPTCEKCKEKRKCSQHLAVFRHPAILIIHIKRFNYTAYSRGKVNTDVQYPLTGLDLSPYISKDVTVTEGHVSSVPPIYDLVGISNHSGGLSGGHYTAHVDTSACRGEQASGWKHFNDNRVSLAGTNTLSGPSAYVLFYKMRNLS
jgi:ubiquitin C-terminal hydrolase